MEPFGGTPCISRRSLPARGVEASSLTRAPHITPFLCSQVRATDALRSTAAPSAVLTRVEGPLTAATFVSSRAVIVYACRQPSVLEDRRKIASRRTGNHQAYVLANPRRSRARPREGSKTPCRQSELPAGVERGIANRARTNVSHGAIFPVSFGKGFLPEGDPFRTPAGASELALLLETALTAGMEHDDRGVTRNR